jgi:hypothetical protein
MLPFYDIDMSEWVNLPCVMPANCFFGHMFLVRMLKAYWRDTTVTDVDMDALFKCINSIDRFSFVSNGCSFEGNTHSLFLYRL